jgi:hypothetical protein
MDQHEHRGGCHCGNLRWTLRSALSLRDLPVRTCGCRFCRKHGLLTTSDPQGEMDFSFTCNLSDAPGLCGASSHSSAEEAAMVQSALSAVRDLAPLIAKHADEAERARRLARPVVDALVDAGVFRLLVPACLGGAGVNPMELCDIIEASRP